MTGKWEDKSQQELGEGSGVGSGVTDMGKQTHSSTGAAGTLGLHLYSASSQQLQSEPPGSPFRY